MRVIVAGALSVEPFSAGIALDWIQVVIGLERLGHEVLFVEELRADWPVDRFGRPASYEKSVNRQRFADLMKRFGLQDRSCQLYAPNGATTGLSRKDLQAWVEGADLLLNMSGHLEDARVLDRVPVKAYVDQDPVYTQLWAAEYGEDLGFDRHDLFFTVGLEIGTSRCPIPTAGVTWHPTLPVIVSDLWTPSDAPDSARFTTIASLSGYAELAFEGRSYGPKYTQFERFADLPRRANETLEATLKAYRPGDPLIHQMLKGGWTIREGGAQVGIDRYSAYIAQSKGEMGIAQQAYVESGSGWFSDRSAQYLAMGKPVLAQATGFEHHLPVGTGLLAFSDGASALEGIAAINADYSRHSRAARMLAERFFDYRAVLPPLLETCRSAAPSIGVHG